MRLLISNKLKTIVTYVCNRFHKPGNDARILNYQQAKHLAKRILVENATRF